MLAQEKILSRMIKSLSNPRRREFLDYGTQVGKLYTDQGLPLDIAISELKKIGVGNDDMVVILEGALNWFIQHKRNSGAGDKAIARQQELNVKIMNNFIDGKETGLY